MLWRSSKHLVIGQCHLKLQGSATLGHWCVKHLIHATWTRFLGRVVRTLQMRELHREHFWKLCFFNSNNLNFKRVCLCVSDFNPKKDNKKKWLAARGIFWFTLNKCECWNITNKKHHFGRTTHQFSTQKTMENPLWKALGKPLLKASFACTRWPLMKIRGYIPWSWSFVQAAWTCWG